jgi:predicted TIM-barrel fold metal-dependent hydrolase
MNLTIDVHAHVYNGMDMPLKGYLKTRNYPKCIKWLIHLIIPSVAYCIRKKLEPVKKKGVFYRIFCPLFNAVLHLVPQYCKWAQTLSLNVDTVACELAATYREKGIDFYVPLILDFEYWFKNSPDNPLKEQIEYFYNEIVVPYGGLYHPFVPFDPLRELAYRNKRCNPDGHLEKDGSMSLVKDAIENKGFIGVKLYNAVGYKPLHNDDEETERNRKRVLLKTRRSFIDKYDFNGKEYDQVLCELYEYCIDNDIPITTHSNMYGTEPYYGASYHFGKAEFWRDLLDQDKYKNLHLNLAHFGWYFKQGYHGSKSWVKDICEMFDDYPHLYTDVAHHRVVNKKFRQQFLTGYRDMLEDFPITKERILFGIDWHVIIRVKNYEKFKETYVSILKENNLFSDEEIDAFLGGNALKFLCLNRGESNWNRLKSFYKKHHITPPDWYKSI